MHPDPSHDDISERARRLWQESGQPSDRDDEIWLEAERQLKADAGPASSDAAFVERAKSETAAESVVEYNITPAVKQQEAIQAALQKTGERPPTPFGKKARGRTPGSGKLG